MKRLVLMLAVIAMGFGMQAQTVDEILKTYFENIGGKENFKKIKAIKMVASVEAQPGLTLPLTIINQKDGKQMVKFELQGQEIVQIAFDGTTAWGVNFQSMKQEKKDNEIAENLKRQKKEFPDVFLNYKENGYTIELVGTETFEGTECYKLKVNMKTQLVEGKEVARVSYYYFDTENMVPIAREEEVLEGTNKGVISQSIFSDYQEVDGMYFPFSMTQGVKDGPQQTILISEIVINPTLDSSIFDFKAE